MGKYKLAEGVDQFKGSLEGSTFQKCGQVFSIRKHNTPVQKRSVKQSASKNRFEHVQTSYRTLDSLEKATFANQTENFTRINSLGNEYTLLPVQLFSSSSNALVATGQPILREMSDPVIFPEQFADTVEMTIITFVVHIYPSGKYVPPGFTMRVEATRPLPLGVQAVENDFVFLKFNEEGVDFEGVDLGPEYEQAFGRNPNWLGLQFFGRTSYISNTNGQSGERFIQPGIIVL